MIVTLTKKYLKHEYITNKKCVRKIAEQSGCSLTKIYNAMRKFNIKRRNKWRIGTDYTGKKFGEWVVKEHHPTRHSTWICVCSCCGCKKAVRSSNFLNGSSKKCSNCRRKGCGEIDGTTWSGIKNGAVQRSLEFNITVQDAWELYLKQDRKCALSKLPIEFKGRGKYKTRSATTASLDRIDSTKGYVHGNIQWVYKKINIMKQNYNQNEFIKLCCLIAENSK